MHIQIANIVKIIIYICRKTINSTKEYLLNKKIVRQKKIKKN